MAGPPYTASPGAKRGDVELYGLKQFPMKKKTGSGSQYEIEIGLILVQDTSLTPYAVKVAGAGAVGPHYMSRGMRFKPDVETDYNMNDRGTWLAALDTDPVVSAVQYGSMCLLENIGDLEPGDRVMCAANGKITLYDGSGLDKVVGTYFHKPGEGDGKSLATHATTGDLVWVMLGAGR